MDLSRSVKRLVVILALAIVVILVSKSLLSKAAKNLSIEAEKKQQAQLAKLRATLPPSAPAQDFSISSAPSGNMESFMQSAPLATENPAAAQ